MNLFRTRKIFLIISTFRPFPEILEMFFSTRIIALLELLVYMVIYAIFGNSWKVTLLPDRGIGDFFESGDFYPRDWEFFQIWGFLSRGFGILSPGLGIFFKSGDFYPGDLGFLSPGLGIFSNLGIFILGDCRFFSRNFCQTPAISTKSPGFIHRRLGIFMPGIFW